MDWSNSVLRIGSTDSSRVSYFERPDSGFSLEFYISIVEEFPYISWVDSLIFTFDMKLTYDTMAIDLYL